MSLVSVITLALKASVFLTVLGFALNATLADATCLFRAPGKLLRALLSMTVITLVVAVIIVAIFDLYPPVKIALVTLALSPVPPLLPGKIIKAGGGESYTIGLLTAAALFSIVSIPLSLEVLQRVFGIPLGMTPWAVAIIVLTTVLAPLAVGIVLHALAPALAESFAKPVSLFARILLTVSALPILFAAWPSVWSLIGNGTIVTLAVFVAICLAIGHLLGGPDLDEKRTLALATASHHPGVALAVAHASFPGQKLAMSAVVLYLLVSAFIVVPYQKWFHRRYPRVDAPLGGATPPTKRVISA